MPAQQVSARGKSAHAFARAQARDDVEQIVALLKRICLARAAGDANPAAVELQHVEACLMQLVHDASPGGHTLHASGRVRVVVVGPRGSCARLQLVVRVGWIVDRGYTISAAATDGDKG